MDLLIGPEGMLGRAWKTLLETKGLPLEAVSRPEFDLTSDASLARVSGGNYDRVINCAAWTDVDGAEAKEAQATAVNGDAVGRLAACCAEAGSVLVHYSTDYVFPGDATAPYRVDGAHDPVNAYGRGKARGETLVRESGAEHLILRTSWLYAPWGKNFVLTMRKLGAERDSLRVVNDQRGRPTSAQHLASASLALLEAGARGTLHVTDGGECTWHELAAAVVATVNPDCDVQPCSSDAFPRPAVRPAYSVLDLRPTEALLGPMPHWRDNVAAVLSQAD
ncbi:MAG: dTDP-4-dehydrorhamnose reductase [Nannocystaceae bacterium]|nr:dTDP-4-dehydrorhamnose reductase [Nannocystaceae bacterium]